MAETAIDVTPKDSPNYVGWRTDLLAKLALTRLAGVAYFAGGVDDVFDFVVAPKGAPVFFVEVKGFSSFRTKPREVETQPVLLWRLPAAEVRRARKAFNPVVLFVFDADGEHGRFARLDTLPAPRKGTDSVAVRLPIENTINKESLEQLIESFRVEAKQPA